MPEGPSPQSSRHRLQLSVRGSIALVLLLGGGLGWTFQRAQVQRDVASAIRSKDMHSSRPRSRAFTCHRSLLVLPVRRFTTPPVVRRLSFLG